MMKKHLIITILFFFLFGCENKRNTEKKNSETFTVEKYTEIIDNKLVYKLINQVLSENPLYKNCGALIDRKTFIIRNGDEFLLKEIDTVFSESDKKFIVKQYRNGNWFILDQKLIHNKKIIELDTTIKTENQRVKFWKKIGKENSCIGYISVPLFNLKKIWQLLNVKFMEKAEFFFIKSTRITNGNCTKLYKS